MTAIASGVPRLFRPVLPRLSTDQGSGPRSGERKAIVARLPRPSADCAGPPPRRCRKDKPATKFAAHRTGVANVHRTPGFPRLARSRWCDGFRPGLRPEARAGRARHSRRGVIRRRRRGWWLPVPAHQHGADRAALPAPARQVHPQGAARLPCRRYEEPRLYVTFENNTALRYGVGGFAVCRRRRIGRSAS